MLTTDQLDALAQRTLRDLRSLAPLQRDAVVEQILRADPELRPVLPELRPLPDAEIRAPARSADPRQRHVRKRRANDDLYWAARLSRDIEAVASGNPKRIARRITNKIVSHYLWRLLRGVFRA